MAESQDSGASPREISLPGNSIIVVFNLTLPGLFMLGLSLFELLSPDRVAELFNTTVFTQVFGRPLTFPEMHTMALTQLVVAIFYIATSLGLMKYKNWARVAVIYFAFFGVVLLVVSSFAQGVGFLTFVQAFHPGAMIVYYTNKNVATFFTLRSANLPV